MNEKEIIKSEIQNTINELDKLMILNDDIATNWNDIVATTFFTKYKQIEANLAKAIQELDELQKNI